MLSCIETCKSDIQIRINKKREKTKREMGSLSFPTSWWCVAYQDNTSCSHGDWRKLLLWETRQYFWIKVPPCLPTSLKDSIEIQYISMEWKRCFYLQSRPKRGWKTTSKYLFVHSITWRSMVCPKFRSEMIDLRSVVSFQCFFIP